MPILGLVMLDHFILHKARNVNGAKRWHQDTAREFVFDDFVGKQVVHVSATSFRSGAEWVSMPSRHAREGDLQICCLTHDVPESNWNKIKII